MESQQSERLLQRVNGNMIKFPATFHGFRKTVLGESLLTLSIDETFSKEAAELLGKHTNAMFMVYLEDMQPEDNIKEDSKD
jgi:integrase